MSALLRRVSKLEATISDPTGERQQRIAAGLCPDCGIVHGYMPTNGGAWRCVVCGNRFELRPEPACQQQCPMEGRRGCNARQLVMPDHPLNVEWLTERRMRHAVDDLRDSMLPEHVELVHHWTNHHVGDGRLVDPGESWYARLERWQPPALVRAVWLLIAHHVETRLSVSLAPGVAEVYLSDADAWPVRPCVGCGYPMPGRAKLRPDSTYEHVGDISLGACPICSLAAVGRG
jgi:hypothetical protein